MHTTEHVSVSVRLAERNLAPDCVSTNLQRHRRKASANSMPQLECAWHSPRINHQALFQPTYEYHYLPSNKRNCPRLCAGFDNALATRNIHRRVMQSARRHRTTAHGPPLRPVPSGHHASITCPCHPPILPSSAFHVFCLSESPGPLPNSEPELINQARPRMPTYIDGTMQPIPATLRSSPEM
ncbi:hypothetical protein CDD80_244 [Ophiocordyceps camponoti-rufipedis]|uniref:Uncharacterized protein n=1 Tax=Ophiocordyceps camponoti-rufipedis TaxID=2004952 RepID=A0A2C5YKG2_9HYPO|nr:hypothetical protein CDD80_244 [Ophiocordyceps camponoti-rufipedis]